MFARTKRLTLRPPWPEDAGALAQAIGHDAVLRMLLRVPSPYTLADAQAFCAAPRPHDEPRFVIVAHDGGGAPALIGGIGISEQEGTPNLGYWLTPSAWGRGYATEAGRAVVAMARHALPIERLAAWHFADNPASGAVLRKLGFCPTGRTTPRESPARSQPAATVGHELDLSARCEPMPIAA
ncbi:GNAT family N-acetyltransferase [Sphingomonas kyungheensis]|uniref:GNAT family N-acetyltransferase n=1 Tax=Sphingomonas kyungheensis TaxID=1069987 RepID=A0ABU8GZN1_9SPHN